MSGKHFRNMGINSKKCNSSEIVLTGASLTVFFFMVPENLILEIIQMMHRTWSG